MRGVNRLAPRHKGARDHGMSRNRAVFRSVGHAGPIAVRAAAVVGGLGSVALMAAAPAVAKETHQQLANGPSTSTVSLAQSDPMVFGLGLAGLFWLVAGLLALVVGVVLATRGAHRPAVGGGSDPRQATTGATGNDKPGMAPKGLRDPARVNSSRRQVGIARCPGAGGTGRQVRHR